MGKKKNVYLDFAGATPITPAVKSAMTKTLDNFYNSSSVYQKGVEAKKILEDCRQKTADAIGARKSEIIFTASGTEANNMAVIGIAQLAQQKIKNPHILISAIEHSSVLEPARALKKKGFEVEEILPDENGIISAKEIRKRIKKKTVLVSIMFVNNEIGTIEPIREIAKEVRKARKIFGHEFPYFHTDACQAPNVLEINAQLLGVDLLTLDSSKFYGPKAGLLYKKHNVELEPIIYGGGQEKNLRSGTENLPAIVGLNEALCESKKMHKKEAARLEKIQKYFERGILKIKDAEIIALNAPRAPHISSIFIPNLDAEFAVFQLDKIGVMCASASACQTLKNESGSYVIDALYKDSGDKERKNSTLRFSFGRSTKKTDIDFCLKALSIILFNQWNTLANNK